MIYAAIYLGGLGLYWDSTYLLIIIGLILSLLASSRVKSTFRKYAQVRNYSGLTGAQAAERVLQSQGIYDVTIERIAGDLTDHYDPRTKVLRLSETVYGNASIAAVGVAAHECGHAMQHQENYAPLKIRSAIVPAANLGSQLSWPIFAAGLIFSIQPLLVVGIVLFTAAVVFQLVTLPVEFNASGRALLALERTGILSEQENQGAKKVLSAAALTYVAALASSVLQLLRLIILAGGRRDRD